MIRTIDPGTKTPGINIVGPVVFSRGVYSKSENGPVDLAMSILMPGLPSQPVMANPNIEIEGSMTDKLPKLPTILWIPGGGWRGQSRDSMNCELGRLCRAGYVVACMDYRSSAQANYPAQIEDVKTAIRFLRARGSSFWVDPERIAVMGRSAGGHLASIAAMNHDEHTSAEWQGYSGNVSCCVDFFGPTDLEACLERTKRMLKIPGFRWSRLEDTHEGALLKDLEPETVRSASPYALVCPDMAPTLILHGDSDRIVPCQISQAFYDKITEVCGEGRAELVYLKGAGHGTDEFWQDETMQLVADFLNKHLKN